MTFGCSNPESLETIYWIFCYLSNGKHLAFYGSIVNVLILLALAAPSALILGLSVALAANSSFLPLSLFGKLFIQLIRGIPEIAWFMFFVIALDQGLQWLLQMLLVF